MRTCICYRFVSFLIVPTNMLRVSSGRVPRAQRETDRPISPSYAFLTDNDTPVESVADFSPYGSSRQLQRLKRRLVK
jgi:hypothetical protein